MSPIRCPGLVLSTLTTCLLGPAAGRAAEKALKPNDLRRGLVAVYRDAGKPPAETTRLEPTIALALKAGEAPHPRLRADGGTVRWSGYINVVRAGRYRFQVMVRGKFRLRIAGNVVLVAESKGTAATLKEGKAVMLPAGVQPLVAEFTRLPGAARVGLTWQGPGFRREPLPSDAVGHLSAKAPAALRREAQLEQGRFLVEEGGCARCHQPDDKDRMAKGLADHAGPDLAKVGNRIHPGWLDRWLEAPRRLRPATVMPPMFSADERGRVERYAVARYLTSLGGPVPKSKGVNKGAALRGERLFNGLGCVACHGPVAGGNRAREEETPSVSVLYRPASIYPLGGLGSKTTPERLADFLKDPLALAPGGRMPHMLLQSREALDLAHFLCCFTGKGLSTALPTEPGKEKRLAAFGRLESDAGERTAFGRQSADRQWLDLGKRLVIAKGCNNCHTIAPGGKPFASVLASAELDEIKKPHKQGAGCLAEDARKAGSAPRFAFSKGQRAAVNAFLAKGLRGAGSPAPAYVARRDLQRFNCLACHTRDGEGGLPAAVITRLRQSEKAVSAEAVVPPSLTGVGHKLRTPWLRAVLLEAGRARPWMGLRMPQFGAANVRHLPEALAALEGAEADDRVHKVKLSRAALAAGRALVGNKGFGCIGCHDIAGIANTGTRGPDLATQSKRVRYAWYRRWLEQPQRMAPGTRMPTVFGDGKSLLGKVLGGKADAQAEAIWGYLAQGPGLPLPDGVKGKRKGR
jgi:mono/diheme cytochrome c family protein